MQMKGVRQQHVVAFIGWSYLLAVMHNLSIYLTYTNPSFFEFRTERAKSLSLCLVELVVDLGSSFWGMALILASTNLLTARIAAAGLGLALFIVLFIAKNVRRSHYFSYLTKFISLTSNTEIFNFDSGLSEVFV